MNTVPLYLFEAAYGEILTVHQQAGLLSVSSTVTTWLLMIPPGGLRRLRPALRAPRHHNRRPRLDRRPRVRLRADAPQGPLDRRRSADDEGTGLSVRGPHDSSSPPAGSRPRPATRSGSHPRTTRPPGVREHGPSRMVWNRSFCGHSRKRPRCRRSHRSADHRRRGPGDRQRRRVTNRRVHVLAARTEAHGAFREEGRAFRKTRRPGILVR
jgi:hypothetical protein